MSKEISFSINERVALSKLLNTFNGTSTQLALFLDDMKQVAMTDAEWESAELKKTPIIADDGKPTGQENWNWQNKPELAKAITLTPDVTLWVLNKIKEKDEKGEFTMADTDLLTIKTKLTE